MDIVSHGLWGGIAFGRKSKRSYWLAFLFGILPDLLAFGPYFVLTWLGVFNIPGLPRLPNIPREPPDPSLIPDFVFKVYNISHSLIVFLILFAIVWLILRRPLFELSAWGLHILIDIPTHSDKFFPTPFLWPASNLYINGHSWTSPEIFIPNVLVLVGLHVWFFIARQRRRFKTQSI